MLDLQCRHCSARFELVGQMAQIPSHCPTCGTETIWDIASLVPPPARSDSVSLTYQDRKMLRDFGIAADV